MNWQVLDEEQNTYPYRFYLIKPKCIVVFSTDDERRIFSTDGHVLISDIIDLTQDESEEMLLQLRALYSSLQRLTGAKFL